MAFTISDFTTQLIGDGARPNLFAVTLVFPTQTNNAQVAGQKMTFMAKASQLPGSSIGVIPQYYFGRELKYPGNRSFADWTLTIINDEDFIIRSALENWSNLINSHQGNLRDPSAVYSANYSVDAKVDQYGKAGNIIKTYNFQGMFPVAISPIDLDWGSNDTIEEYTTTFAYQIWTTDSTT